MLPSSPIAFVTGANRGIGFEVCRHFSESGMRVLLASRVATDLHRRSLRLSRKRFALVDDLASVDSVLQHEVKGAARKPLPAIGAPVRRRAAFADDASGGEIIPQGAHRLEFESVTTSSRVIFSKLSVGIGSPGG